MVKSVAIKNFKSIADLRIDLGRVNVFIGENGSGKSNILEAVAFGAAASADKLDKQFLTSRGIRVPEPKQMRSAFDKINLDKEIHIKFSIKENSADDVLADKNFYLHNENDEFSKWRDEGLKRLSDFFTNLNVYLKDQSKDKKPIAFYDQFTLTINPIINKDSDPNIEVSEFNIGEPRFDSLRAFLKYSNPKLNSYKVFAPENTFLRRFEDEEAGDPLGIRGEGLFKLLRYFQNNEDKKYINEIKEALSSLDWFEGFEIPDGLASGERKLSIRDRFIDTDISLSQNSANEGFLFILFYISLFVSEDTPSFFGIDNIDASFNPKLCKRIIQILVKAAKDSNKQALFTTHNPFILDGLDLTDDEQRLYVVYRNLDGHTIAKRVMPNERKMKLSEQWMSGFLGGLPENF